MTPTEFLLLARMEMRQHGLMAKGWVAEHNMRLGGATLARCKAPAKKLEFTARAMTTCYSMALWIIRHEMAHALHWEVNGSFLANVRNSYHGKEFRKWCRVVKCPATTRIPI